MIQLLKVYNGPQIFEAFSQERTYYAYLVLYYIVVVLYRSNASLCRYQCTYLLSSRAVCRDDSKPGACPKLRSSSGASCPDDCESDGDCKGNQKCCYAGACGLACADPVQDPGADIPDYDSERYQGSYGPRTPQRPQTSDPNAPRINVSEL